MFIKKYICILGRWVGGLFGGEILGSFRHCSPAVTRSHQHDSLCTFEKRPPNTYTHNIAINIIMLGGYSWIRLDVF